MILDLSVRATFPSSGFTLEAKFQPQTGITAVVGPNGVGKTFSTIEMTRYLLFGKKALRGAAADYKTLEARGEFLIRGERFIIERNAKRESLTDDVGTVLAVGAEAVTQKVTELMGYGLKVFDICNASVQKNATFFGQLRPAERKRLIDQVVGLTSNEAVEKACRAEATILRREVEALARVLNPPVAPVKPDEPRTADQLGCALAEARDVARIGLRLKNTIRPADEPEKPHSSVPFPRPGEIEDMEQDERNRLDLAVTKAQLEDQAQYAQMAVRYSEDDLTAARERNTLRKLMANALECPNCHHEFVPGHGEVVMPDGPDLTPAEISEAEVDLRRVAKGQEAEAELVDWPDMIDQSAALAHLRHADKVWLVYDTAKAAYDRQVKANAEAEAELEKLGVIPQEAELDDLRDKLYAAQTYEQAAATFAVALADFQRDSAAIEDKRKLAEEYKKGGDALADARATLKAFLAPRLSRVASTLIHDMTLGKLSSVIVDEDMEITVNGQQLETLSGGGETVANIALRIALGQVLVAETFPVFLGDEIDADIDDQRREAIAEAMVGLKDHLKQIILVTHRDVTLADHVYDLGNTKS